MPSTIRWRPEEIRFAVVATILCAFLTRMIALKFGLKVPRRNRTARVNAVQPLYPDRRKTSASLAKQLIATRLRFGLGSTRQPAAATASPCGCHSTDMAA